MAAGPRALFVAIEQPLSTMAERVRYLGERPDLAAVYKLCGNAFIIGIAGVAADVFTIASQNGVQPSDAVNVVEFFNVPGVFSGRVRNMAMGNFAPTFELDMARKDVRLMLEAAGGAPLAVLPGLSVRMDSLIASGHGDQDLAIIGLDALRWRVRRNVVTESS
jgi:3-hydroxyisobutyrate dehydrogenase-like beta-hydroxyacid dehydrogenase